MRKASKYHEKLSIYKNWNTYDMGMGKTRVRVTSSQQQRWINDFEQREKLGNYEAFYRSQDITSSGIKGKIACPNNPGRVYQTLSLNETFTLVQLLHDPLVVDIKEQWAVTDLNKSRAFAAALAIKHPTHVWSSTSSVITWDFLCDMKFGPKRAISVKPENLLKDKRTEEKLKLEKVLAESLNYEHQIVTDKEVKTEEVKNIFRFLRGAKIDAYLRDLYPSWLEQLPGLIAGEGAYESLSDAVQKAATKLSISYNESFVLMQHAFWKRDVSSDPTVPLYPEHSPYFLRVNIDA